MITCSLVSPVFLYNLEQIQKQLPNVTFNYSINLTGNEPEGDWIMESSGENIKPIYFNDTINNYSKVLALPISNTLGPNFTYSNPSPDVLYYTLNTAFTISDASPWSIIDIAHSDIAKRVIVDGAGLKITVTKNNFDGMFVAGNFNNYTYRDDMILDGIENCIQYLHNFDPTKSKNPFAYFTQIIYYAFLRRIMKERKQAYIKTKILTSLPPTFFQELGMSDDEISESERNFDKFVSKMSQAIESQNNFDEWLVKKSVARKMKNNIETIDLDNDKDSDYN